MRCRCLGWRWVCLPLRSLIAGGIWWGSLAIRPVGPRSRLCCGPHMHAGGWAGLRPKMRCPTIFAARRAGAVRIGGCACAGGSIPLLSISMLIGRRRRSSGGLNSWQACCAMPSPSFEGSRWPLWAICHAPGRWHETSLWNYAAPGVGEPRAAPWSRHQPDTSPLRAAWRCRDWVGIGGNMISNLRAIRPLARSVSCGPDARFWASGPGPAAFLADPSIEPKALTQPVTLATPITGGNVTKHSAGLLACLPFASVTFSPFGARAGHAPAPASPRC